MTDRADITPELCRQLLRYNPETGKLYWRERSPEMFEGRKRPADLLCRIWNGGNAGQEAFTYIGNHGYFSGSILNIGFTAHRVIWAMQVGEWPTHDIDHIDGDRQNNRWQNLRDVTHAVNLRNAAGKSNNKSGATGVNWRADKGKWRARIMVDGKDVSLGHFDSFDEAVAVREAAQSSCGFTTRHGIL